MRKNFTILVLVVVMVLVGCAPPVEATPVAPSDESVSDTGMVYPESDNDYRWASDSRVEVETAVYVIKVMVKEELTNHTEVSGSGSAFAYGGFASASMRIWQDGKGLLPVEVLSLDPVVEFIETGMTLVLKTSDLKAMGLPNGAVTTFICNMDTEVLSPVEYNQTLTTAHLTKELDNCRMLYPTYSMNTDVAPTPVPPSE